MKIKKLVVSLFSLTMLAGCANKTSASAAKGNIDDVLAGFETSLKGAASLTFTSKYKTDVISEKGGMDSFKHDVNNTVTADVNLIEGDLYLYVKNNAKDKEDAKVREALLYKDATSYKYVTTVMENPVELANETEARAKIDELLGKLSETYTGSIDTTSLVFSKGGAYEHREFGLSTENIAVEDYIGEPTFELADEKTVKVTGDLDYIGYHTDAGISDFPGKDGGKAATYSITTNEKGYVTSYTETMDASLEMPIMNPAPTVTIKGTKTLEAKYDQTIAKKTEISHSLTTTKLSVSDTNFGTVETFTTTKVGGEKTPVANGADLVVGQFLAVKVTPAGTNTVKMVTFNSASKETPEADGYFYFEITEGKASLTVNFTGSDTVAPVTYGTFNVTAAEGITYTAAWFTLVNGAPDSMKPVTDNKVIVGKNNWIGYTVTAPEGKTVKATCNGKAMMFLMNAYCFNVKEEGTYEVKFELEGSTTEPTTYNASIVPLNNQFGMFNNIELFTCKPNDILNMTALGMGDSEKLVAGNWLCIKPKEGCTVTKLTVNEKTCMTGDPKNTGGFYVFTIAEGKNVLDAQITK